MSQFSSSSYDSFQKLILRIPAGRVMSYGQVAKMAGLPRGARMVGWSLRTLPPNTNIPWHRVVNRLGRLSIVHPYLGAEQQAALLRKEGVEVAEVDGCLTLINPPWHTF
ncbi:MAG: MGMT family protein [bacterium]